MSLIETLQRAEPRKGMLFLAIEHLSDPIKIKEFYKEYVSYLREHGHSHLAKTNPAKAARRNMEYIFPSHNKEIYYLWLEAIPALSAKFHHK